MEKASLGKIRRLLEISEHESHYEVLLTLKNLADVRQSPTPYSLPIIPRSLPSEIVEGEYFITSDLLSLLAGGAPSTGGLEGEALHQEQALQASYVPSTSTSGDSNSASPGPGRMEGVSARQGFLYQERGLVLPLEYRKSERRGQIGGRSLLVPKWKILYLGFVLNPTGLLLGKR